MKNPEIETIVFSDGLSVTNKIYQLFEGVQLKVHNENEAVLSIHNGYLEIAWNPVTEQAFRSLDTVTAAELLKIIAGNPI